MGMDLFTVIGVITTLIIVIKITSEVLGFLTTFVTGSSVNFKEAGSWAVVTGSTDGIGKAYAEQLAEKGLNVVLVSRSQSKLEAVAKEIENKCKVSTKTITADFTKGDIYENIASQLSDLDIGVLVNNVGGSLTDYPDYFCNRIDTVSDLVNEELYLNGLSTVKMTQVVLPNMVSKKRGYIINIGSSAGCHPLPLEALYSATKACIDSFTLSLQEEYKDSGIVFQCITPHFVATKKVTHMEPSVFNPLPSVFVKSALKTVGKRVVTTGYWMHHIENYFMAIIPSGMLKSFVLDVRSQMKAKAETKKSK